MHFCRWGQLGLVLMLVIALSGCHRRASAEEKKIRHELQTALREHSYERAEQLAQRALEFSPGDNGAWDRLAQAQFGRRDLKAAKQTLAAWRRAVPHPSANVDEYAGDTARDEHDLPLALQSWRAVLQLEPRNTRVLEKVARAYEAQRHWDESETTWTKVVHVQESATALVHRAVARRHLHRWAEAQADLHRAEEMAPDDPEVRSWSKHFVRLSKFIAEIRDLDAQLAVSPRDAALLGDRALLFLRSEDFELALDDSEAAEKLASWAMRPRLFMGIALIKLGRASEAEKIPVRESLRLEALTPEFLETISRLDSEISAERNNAELYTARAWQLNEIGQPALALRDAESAAQLDATSAAASIEESYALMKLGRADDSFAQIKRATELDANSTAAWNYRGELEMKRQEYAAAIESFTHAIAINKSAEALERRVECYLEIGLPAKADADRRELEKLGTRDANE
jgi:tetratricopeptide (TPR) repeat protein